MKGSLIASGMWCELESSETARCLFMAAMEVSESINTVWSYPQNYCFQTRAGEGGSQRQGERMNEKERERMNREKVNLDDWLWFTFTEPKL